MIVHPADDWNPAPTSNGKSLLFVSDRGVDGNYRSKIFNYDIQSNQVHSILMQDYDYSFPCIQSNKDQFLFLQQHKIYSCQTHFLFALTPV